MPVLDARLADLEQEFDANFTSAEWTADVDTTAVTGDEASGEQFREIQMDLGTLGGSRPRVAD